MPEATWKPHEKHCRLTAQSDPPDSLADLDLILANPDDTPLSARLSFGFGILALPARSCWQTGWTWQRYRNEWATPLFA